MSADEYPAPAEVHAAELGKADARLHETREWKPKPQPRDVLRNYRGNPDYTRRRLEPEFV